MVGARETTPIDSFGKEAAKLKILDIYHSRALFHTTNITTLEATLSQGILSKKFQHRLGREPSKGYGPGYKFGYRETSCFLWNLQEKKPIEIETMLKPYSGRANEYKDNKQNKVEPLPSQIPFPIGVLVSPETVERQRIFFRRGKKAILPRLG